MWVYGVVASVLILIVLVVIAVWSRRTPTPASPSLASQPAQGPSGVQGSAKGPAKDEVKPRLAWFRSTRSDRSGKVLRGVYGKAVEQRRRQQVPSGVVPLGLPPSPPGPLGSFNWTPLGPSVIAAPDQPRLLSGRVTAIVAGPGSSRVYAGTANGGVWRTDNGGQTWTPLDDYVASPAGPSANEADSLSVGALAVRFGTTGDSDELYVGTGEPNPVGDNYFGIGIRHYTPSGASGSWTLEATNLAGYAIYAIVIDPDDPTRVLAATTAGLFRRPSGRSAATWDPVAGVGPTYTDPVLCVTSLIVAGSGAGKRYYVAFQFDQVYVSPDSVVWSPLSGIGAGPRLALAAGESDPTVVYALTERGGLYRLVGTEFQPITGLPPSVIFPSGQGSYDIAIAVDPINANRLYVVGDVAKEAGRAMLAMFCGDVSGGPGRWTFPFNAAHTYNPVADATWIGRDIHADGHAICFGLNASGIGHDPTNVWVGCDGGVWHSASSGAIGTFVPRNTGLAITQPTFLGQRYDTDAVMFAGTQDNGTVRYIGEPAWLRVAGADGGGVAVDPNDPYRVMRQSYYSALSRSMDGGATLVGVNFPPVTSDTAAQNDAYQAEFQQTGFYTPIVTTAHGVTPTLAAFATNRLWITADWGDSWVTLPTATNPYASPIPDASQDVIDGSWVTAIAVASATRIYAATLDRTIWRYDRSGSGTWSHTEIPRTGLPWNSITDLAVVDGVAGTLYLTNGGGDGGGHCWYYDGTTWHEALRASTIDVPTHAVVVDPADPQTVYVGTDVGCWKARHTAPTTWTWEVFSDGLPEAAIVDLVFHERTRLLRAALHGRGVWEVAVDTPAHDPDLYLRVNYADTGRITGGTRYPWVEGAADPTMVGANVYHWMSPDIKVRRPSLTGLPPLSATVDFLDFATNIGDYVETSTDIETVDESSTDQVFVQVHNRSLFAVAGADVRVLLLITDASTMLPNLPADYADHINAGDEMDWLGTTSWQFADPSRPYRRLTGSLDVRTPQVAQFDVDFSTLGLPFGHDHVCAAAFVTTGDLITATDPSLNVATMQDKHIAHRNLHLVPLGAMPDGASAASSSDGGMGTGATFLLDVNNVDKQSGTFDLVFDSRNFPGGLSVMLPGLSVSDPTTAFADFDQRPHAGDGTWAAPHRDWLQGLEELLKTAGTPQDQPTTADKAWRARQIRKLAALDRRHSYVARRRPECVLRGVQIPTGTSVAVAITVQAPPDARPGDRYRLDVIQRAGQHIVGGSSYEIVLH